MTGPKRKKPSVRGESATTPSLGAGSDQASTAASREESEFLARAWAMEVEAAERYAMLADAMEEHNNPEVAELFRKLARIEQLHADGIVESREHHHHETIVEPAAAHVHGPGCAHEHAHAPARPGAACNATRQR